MDEASAIMARARELIKQTELLVNNPEAYFANAGIDAEILEAARAIGFTAELRAEAEQRVEQVMREVDREVSELSRSDWRAANKSPKKTGKHHRNTV